MQRLPRGSADKTGKPPKKRGERRAHIRATGPDMSRIRSVDTMPELLVRELIDRLGIKYRLHCDQLPGKPDIVFLRRRKVVFVHGCFWHHHAGCKRAFIPTTQPEYWIPKLKRNQERDRRSVSALARQGWRVLTIWECELRDRPSVARRLARFLRNHRRPLTLRAKS